VEIFELIVDEKVQVWRRSRIKIEAKSQEEAVKDCLIHGINQAYAVIDSEYLSETEENLNTPGNITIEVMDTQYNILGDDYTR